MKKVIAIISILFLIVPMMAFSSDAEEIIVEALKQSLTEGSFLNFDRDLAFISWTTRIEEDSFSPEKEYIGQIVWVNYLHTKDYAYSRLEYPVFSMISDITKETAIFYTRNSAYYYEDHMAEPYGYSAKASIAELVDGEIRLKGNYLIQSIDDEIIRDRQAWKITINNEKAKSTTIFWIDKEYNVRLREDYYERYPVLYQRIEYLDYQSLDDGTLIEKEYYIWGQNFPRFIRYYQIKDPTFTIMEDKYFKPEILTVI